MRSVNARECHLTSTKTLESQFLNSVKSHGHKRTLTFSANIVCNDLMFINNCFII